MKKIIKKANHFFFKESNNYTWIVYFRISIGLFILIHFISILPDFNFLYSKNGLIPTDIQDVFVPNFVITLPKIINFLSSYGIIEDIILNLYIYIYILLSFLLLFGVSPRIVSSFLLFLQIALIKSSPFYSYGVDFFTSMSLFYLILIPSHYQYSLNTYLKIPIKIENINPYKRLFQIHLSIAYFFSGFDKVIGFNWWNGESVWKAINLPLANNDFYFDFSFFAHHSILLIIIGWCTIIIEMCYPIFIWISRTRKIWLYLTISMHLGIALILNLYFFSALMIIWNLTNFYFDDKQ